MVVPVDIAMKLHITGLMLRINFWMVQEEEIMGR